MSDQDKTTAFLERGRTYGEPGEKVVRIDTHAAMIFLVGERAYKMKRAVRYDFLDFSTLEKRKDALEAELRLNRRTAPDLYHRTLPVRRDDDGELTLEDDGEVVEWLLEMQRFDQDGLLDKLALAGRLNDQVIDRLATAVADLHDRADVRIEGGGHDAMKEVIRGNHDDLAEARAKGFIEQDVEWLHTETLRALDDHRECMELRRERGFVRRCHGDLHLGNIVLIDGAPVLFDCLEFDEDLATIDTFYDLALLLMDLCHRDLRPSAQHLLNVYLERTGDDEGTALLPLFLSVRAAMRAKVDALKAEQIDMGEDRGAILEEVEDYLDLARQVLRPDPPILLAIGGVSGTGKTTLAANLASTFGVLPGAVHLRSDVTRKRLFGARPTEALPDEAYTSDVSNQVYASLAERATTLLANGRSVILDATFLRADDRKLATDLARRTNATFRGLWLAGEPKILAERIERREGDASDATVDVLEQQLASEPDEMSWRRIDASGEPDQVAAEARRGLRLPE